MICTTVLLSGNRAGPFCIWHLFPFSEATVTHCALCPAEQSPAYAYSRYRSFLR
jgi:hypothetical protein